jgi:hypothetical protein
MRRNKRTTTTSSAAWSNAGWHEQLDNLGRQQPTHQALTRLIRMNTVTCEQDIVNRLAGNLSVALEGVENVNQGQ